MSDYCVKLKDCRWFFQEGLESPVRLPRTKFFLYHQIIKPLLPLWWSVVVCSLLKYTRSMTVIFSLELRSKRAVLKI